LLPADVRATAGCDKVRGRRKTDECEFRAARGAVVDMRVGVSWFEREDRATTKINDARAFDGVLK